MISVITATHRNWPQLRRAMDSLGAQSFTDWQHVVVADGPDPGLRGRMYHRGYAAHGQRVFVELGRNWHSFLGGDGSMAPGPGARGGRGSRGVSAYLAATYLAAGSHIGYLDSDCEYLPDHLERCWQALQDTGAGLVFARMERWLDGRPWDVIGDGTLAHGHVDGNMVVHDARLLARANWRHGGDADWDLIGRWYQAGVRTAYVPRVTVHWHHSAADI